MSRNILDVLSIPLCDDTDCILPAIFPIPDLGQGRGSEVMDPEAQEAESTSQTLACPGVLVPRRQSE